MSTRNFDKATRGQIVGAAMQAFREVLFAIPGEKRAFTRALCERLVAPVAPRRRA
jgi:hypothetical protein